MQQTTSSFLAIDPGASGSLCLLVGSTSSFVDFKKEGLKGYIDFLKQIEPPSIACIEKVHAMPGQGVKSMFSFGQRLGELEGIMQALGFGYVQVRPQEWQKACGIKPKSGKKGIHEVISKVYPSAVLLGPKGGIMDGRCDALSMCHYLRKTY